MNKTCNGKNNNDKSINKNKSSQSQLFFDIRICKDEKSITEINIKITTTTAVIKNELKYF